MQAPAYASLRRQDLVPHENFRYYLDENSPDYAADLAYLEAKRAGLPMTDERYREAVTRHPRKTTTRPHGATSSFLPKASPTLPLASQSRSSATSVETLTSKC